MHTAQVIPFRFEAREVRTLLIDDQPWFVAADVASALQYLTAKDMARNLDDDEKGRQILPTLGGDQEMLVINESGLYSAILRSRKAEAKRFKRWVTAEVLPAIRKQGRYEDADNRMATLVGQTIGTDGFHMLGAVVKGKVSSLPVPVQRRATAKIWSQTHAAFGVRSAADIPADQLDAARNFIAAYVLEGELLAPEQPALALHYPATMLLELNPHLRCEFGKERICLGVDALCGMDVRSPTLKLIGELARAGHDVEGCRLEVLAMRHHLESYWRLSSDLRRMGEAHSNAGLSFPLR